MFHTQTPLRRMAPLAAAPAARVRRQASRGRLRTGRSSHSCHQTAAPCTRSRAVEIAAAATQVTMPRHSRLEAASCGEVGSAVGHRSGRPPLTPGHLRPQTRAHPSPCTIHVNARALWQSSQYSRTKLGLVAAALARSTCEPGREVGAKHKFQPLKRHAGFDSALLQYCMGG